jgi:hypothetical protein
MQRILAAAAVVLAVTLSAAPAQAQDARQLVKLPPMMQHHMLGNMRDHLLALGDVLALLGQGKVDEAGHLAEHRIGMSSLEGHGAEQMAPFMPEEMRTIGTGLHEAASRFAIAAQNAEVEHTYESQRKVFAALAEITDSCNACHTRFRIR